MDALDKKGLRENTLIIFSSDNGGATNALFATGARSEAERAESGGVALGAKPPASNGLLRGGKGSLYEGGVRTPTVFNWPGRLKPAVVDEPLHLVDVMPTLLALAGGKGSPDHPFDGKDIWATLAEGKPSPHEDILINVEPIRGAFAKAIGNCLRWPHFRARPNCSILPKTPANNTTWLISIQTSCATLNPVLWPTRNSRSRPSGSRRSRNSSAPGQDRLRPRFRYR